MAFIKRTHDQNSVLVSQTYKYLTSKRITWLIFLYIALGGLDLLGRLKFYVVSVSFGFDEIKQL